MSGSLRVSIHRRALNGGYSIDAIEKQKARLLIVGHRMAADEPELQAVYEYSHFYSEFPSYFYCCRHLQYHAQTTTGEKQFILACQYTGY